MAKIVITLRTNSINLKLNTLAADRKEAEIYIVDIRSVCKTNDDDNIELVFTNGEIKTIKYQDVDKVDADTSITSQQILFDKLKNWRFP